MHIYSFEHVDFVVHSDPQTSIFSVFMMKEKTKTSVVSPNSDRDFVV
jgi:hypothetical protein